MYIRKPIFFKLFLIILVIGSLVFIISTKHTNYTKQITIETYTVQQGDTLYEIASKYPHTDIREFVYDIEQMNGITAIIHAGEEIKIPLEVD